MDASISFKVLRFNIQVKLIMANIAYFEKSTRRALSVSIIALQECYRHIEDVHEEG